MAINTVSQVQNNAAFKIQTFVRGTLDRVAIQHSAATGIQSLFRGTQVRQMRLPSKLNTLDLLGPFSEVARHLPLKDLFALTAINKSGRSTLQLFMRGSSNILELGKIVSHRGSTNEIRQAALVRLQQVIAENNNIPQLRVVAAHQGLSRAIRQAARERLGQVVIPHVFTLGALKAFIAAGADVNQADQNGNTPAVMAAGNGHIECLNVLIKAGHVAGIDVANQAANNGVTSAFMAVFEGHLECLNALIEAGADVNQAYNDGTTLAFVAANRGDIDCLNALIAAGADIHQADNSGVTPALIAAQNGHVECSNILRQQTEIQEHVR